MSGFKVNSKWIAWSSFLGKAEFRRLLPVAVELYYNLEIYYLATTFEAPRSRTL